MRRSQFIDITKIEHLSCYSLTLRDEDHRIAWSGWVKDVNAEANLFEVSPTGGWRTYQCGYPPVKYVEFTDNSGQRHAVVMGTQLGLYRWRDTDAR